MTSTELMLEYSQLFDEWQEAYNLLVYYKQILKDVLFIADNLKQQKKVNLVEEKHPETGDIIKSNKKDVDLMNNRTAKMEEYFQLIGVTKDDALELIFVNGKVLEDKGQSLVLNQVYNVNVLDKQLEKKKEEVINAVLSEQNIVF